MVVTVSGVGSADGAIVVAILEAVAGVMVTVLRLRIRELGGSCGSIVVWSRVDNLWILIRSDNCVFHVCNAGSVVIRSSRDCLWREVGLAGRELDSHWVAGWWDLSVGGKRLVVTVLPT